MNKTKIHPNTQPDVSDKRPAEKFRLMHEPIPTTEAKIEQKIRRGHDGSKPFCRGATNFPCTDASKSVTAGLMQSTLVQPAALQCAMKKKEGRLPWEKLFRFGRMDSALLAVFAPEDLNALHRELNRKRRSCNESESENSKNGETFEKLNSMLMWISKLLYNAKH